MLVKSTIEQFAEAFHGQLLQSDDSGYDEARAVWNGMIDRRPLMIARCADTADVISSVNFGREHGLPLTVKSGGHNGAGKAVCDDGLVIDLSPMNSVRVDPDAKTAYVGPGATWADFDREAQAFDLATTGGTDSRTGVAGLTLGGGLGYLARKHGIAADNLLGADVVLADGELVHASEKENADLFWALRGGGGNFGVVTSFEFRLHELGPEIMTAQVFHPHDDGREVLRFYRDLMTDGPDEMSFLAAIVNVPPVSPFPEEQHGRTTVALVGSYAGSLEDGKAALAPVEAFGRPMVAAVAPTPYTALQQSLDAGAPDGMRYYTKSRFLAGLTDEAIEAIIERTASLPGAFTVVFLEPMGGAINRVDPTATAFPHRDATFNFSVMGGWQDAFKDDEIITWVREFHEAMAPYATGGVYMNYLDRDDGERIRAAYGENFERLKRVKARYDPDSLFHINQSVGSTR